MEKKISIEGEIERLSEMLIMMLGQHLILQSGYLDLEFFTTATANKYKEHGEFVTTTHETVKLTQKMIEALRNENFE